MEQFRQETRDWLEANCPPSMRTPGSEKTAVWGGRNARFPSQDAQDWLEAMVSKGWTCPTWSKEYGGGLSHAENMILQSELRRINARLPIVSFGISMLGPVLLEFGTEAQQLEHLPPIMRGEIRWCQGYSEPGAGSDLASLQTRALVDGDDYVVNGSKVWTSYADQADWIFCLVRTDTKAPKHEGISFILFDMAGSGVSTKPIQLISGASPFCETFFDDVRVPRKNLVGKENQGWAIAKKLLQHERNMIAGMGARGAAKDPKRSMEQQAKQALGESNGKLAQAALREALCRHKMDGKAFGLTQRRAAAEAKSSSVPSPASSMFKYYGTEHNKNRFELLLEIFGSHSLRWEDDSSITREWLRSRANSIEGGTSEVQLNVIAKRVLGLPD